ncbi:hypothetical protein GIB67_002626 [Kingdonia uniflora]|uniref:ATP-dependent DNA helicase n=1 Tax=Kingdonia uniflora TaxID=39325 RepID=A0A7J7N4I5_9MAGN|nr:hypothetical protein GIB67_002626 [Kingdonia uniflora]
METSMRFLPFAKNRFYSLKAVQKVPILQADSIFISIFNNSFATSKFSPNIKNDILNYERSRITNALKNSIIPFSPYMGMKAQKKYMNVQYAPSNFLVPRTKYQVPKHLKFIRTVEESNKSSFHLLSTKPDSKQKQILNAISEGKSVFITGSAGTGIAACALSGQILHSFAGVRSGEYERDYLWNQVAGNIPASNRWKYAKALIIDEISMISGTLFDDLDCIAKKIRCNNAPWGGIQLIVSGDFFHLPPIDKRRYEKWDDVKEFVFEANCWNDSFDMQVELTQVYRQGEPQFIKLLQEIRRGFWDTHLLEVLNQCCKTLKKPSVEMPRLYPLNEDVSKVNAENLARLGRKIETYKASDDGVYPWINQLKIGMALDKLEICVGARVMLIKNMDFEEGMVNGAVGKIVNFVKRKGDSCQFPKVLFDSGIVRVICWEKWYVIDGDEVMATRKQIPLRLAYALSVRKCQGMTIDCLEADLSKAFGYGMVYVVLSRVKSLDGLHLIGFDLLKIKAHPKVTGFYNSPFLNEYFVRYL